VAMHLHQVNALIKGTKARTLRAITDAHHDLQRAPLLAGLHRVYKPYDDDGEQLPPEGTHVQITVAATLPQITDALAKLLNLQYAQDTANAIATADVVVDGHTLLTDVPVTYLLFLEKQLVDLRTAVAALPTLDPAERWSWDAQRGCYASEPAGTTRTKKIPRNHVLAEATDRHPAQVQMYTEDVGQGIWTTTKLSGAMPAADARRLLQRVDKLIDAVKAARETANSAIVPDREGPAAALFGWLFLSATAATPAPPSGQR
jgi:hypothetical protein